ncbi:MAG: hypothetical protein M1833_004663 [Piccolia ochrophora]|nr:MAG: hypothetical protein M1833_004663 [Piccolia ochrophora]
MSGESPGTKRTADSTSLIHKDDDHAAPPNRSGIKRWRSIVREKGPAALQSDSTHGKSVADSTDSEDSNVERTVAAEHYPRHTKSQDESRYLPDYTVPKDATPIAVPTSSTRKVDMTIGPTPFAPISTLNGKHPSSSRHVPTVPLKFDNHSASDKKRAGAFFDLHTHEYSLRKKPKLDRPLTSQTSPPKLDGYGERSLRSVQTSTGQARRQSSSVSQPSTKANAVEIAAKGGVAEYRTLEDTVSTSTFGRYRRRASKFRGRVGPPPQPPQPRVNGESGKAKIQGPIHGASSQGIGGLGEPSRPYQGTANLRPSRRATAFDQNPTYDWPIVTAGSRKETESGDFKSKHSAGAKRDPRQRQQPYGNSEDDVVLVSQRTSPESRDQSRRPARRPNNMRDRFRPQTSCREVDKELDPKVFRNPHVLICLLVNDRCRQGKGPLQTQDPARNIKVNPVDLQGRRTWGKPFGIKSLHCGPFLLDEPGCSLVLSEMARELVLCSNGMALQSDGLPISLPLAGIYKLLVEEEGTKIRVFTNSDARTEIRMFDIDFRDLQTTDRFTTAAQKQHSTITQQRKTSDFMSKAFERSKQEYADHLDDEKSPTRSGERELQMLGRSIERNRQQEGHIGGAHPDLPQTKQLAKLSTPKNSDHARQIHEGNPARVEASSNTRRSTRQSLQSLHTHELEDRAAHTVNDRRGSTRLSAQPSRSVVFPVEGPRRTTVDFTDLSRLDEGEFLNDSIIAFYLRYLEHRLEHENPIKASRVYIFNTFFYERLTSTVKGKRGINYEAVAKWTSKVDIFDFDYVIVPVNEDAHWYLAIICNLPKLVDQYAPPASDGPLQDHKPSSDTELAVSRASERKKDSVADASPHSREVGDDRSSPDIAVDQTQAGIAQMLIEHDGQRHQSSEASIDETTILPSLQQEEALSQEWPSANENEAIYQPKFPGSDVIDLDDEPKETHNQSSSPSKGKRLGNSPSLKKGKRQSIGAAARRYSPTAPVIMTLDSLGSAHSQTIRNLKVYLEREGESKRGLHIDISDLQGMTARGIPQQDNFCDCGVYLLGYMEKFMQDPQDMVERILQRQLNEESDWPAMKPNEMRSNTRRILVKLYAKQKRRQQAEAAEKKERLRMKRSDKTSETGLEGDQASIRKVHNGSTRGEVDTTEITGLSAPVRSPSSPSKDPQSDTPPEDVKHHTAGGTAVLAEAPQPDKMPTGEAVSIVPESPTGSPAPRGAPVTPVGQSGGSTKEDMSTRSRFERIIGSARSVADAKGKGIESVEID